MTNTELVRIAGYKVFEIVEQLANQRHPSQPITKVELLGVEVLATLTMLEEQLPLTPEQMFTPRWPEGLPSEYRGKVLCDDNRLAHLTLTIAQGDVWVEVYEQAGENDDFPNIAQIRVRSYFGGGRNLRTRQALLWLALAIQLDAKDKS